MELPKCGVCHGPLTVPRVLPCGHSFCSNCLVQCAQHSPTLFSCPVCKQTHPGISDRNIDSLPRNFELESVIENMKRNQQSARNSPPSRDERSSNAHPSRARPSNSHTPNTRPLNTPSSNSSTRQQNFPSQVGASLSETDEVELRLALSMSLEEDGPGVTTGTRDTEDEDLAKAIYLSQLDADPSLHGDVNVYENSRVFGGVNLKVKNLPPSLTTDQLIQEFSPFGRIISAKVMTGRGGFRNKNSRGYGFVWFEQPSSAQRAMREMNGCNLHGSIIRVDLAKGSAL